MKKIFLFFLLAPVFLQAQSAPVSTMPVISMPILTSTPLPPATKSPTNSPAATGTVPTNTPTFTVTQTPTRTNTLAPTATNTPTATGTLPTNTPTHIATQTPTGTLPTSTPTNTPTTTGTQPTHTSTATNTMTPTATSTPGVSEFKVSPKPEPDGQIKFKWDVTMKSKEVDVKIFTDGFRLVRQFSFDQHVHNEYLSRSPHELDWDGKDEEGRAMPSGTYLCFILVETDKKDYEASGKTEIP